MSKDAKKILLDATAGIREEYIEDAAAPAAKSRPLWVRFAATAAVLALLLGGLLLKPESNPGEPVIPILGIRAYATDGEPIVIENIGDRISVQKDTSELFPGKQVYILDVYVESYGLPDTASLDKNFVLWHYGNRYLRPGESDQQLAVQWLTMEKDGVLGYRIIGWCEAQDRLALTIYGEGQKVLYEKEIRIVQVDDGYEMDVRISYTHKEDRTTDELIEVVMHQDYSSHTMLSSSFSQRFLLNHTGFRELIERPDAPSKLLALFIRSQGEKGIFSLDKIFVGLSADNDWLLNILLTWDEIWEGLTPREQALALGHGCSRLMLDSDSMRFGKDVGYLLQITGPDTADEDSVLEVSYNGVTTRKEDDHIRMFQTIGTAEDGRDVYGWAVYVSFKDKTEVTFTVRDQSGNVLQQEKYLVSRVESEYSAYYEIEKVTS